MNKIHTILTASLLTLATVTGPAFAGKFFQRPLTIIVPAAAGGGGDTTTRMLAHELEKELGQPITIINQGQGGGVVGLTNIRNASPDGYTVGLLFPYAGYKFTGQADFKASDFTPIANFNGDSSALLVAAESPFTNLKQALDALKAKPSTLKIHCSGGCGSVWDVPVAGMMLEYGIDVAKINWIPGQGAATGLTELASGGVDFQTASLPEAASLMQAGRLRALAVWSLEPVEGFDSVPLVGATTGHPQEGGTWRALGGPAGMPAEAVKAWESAMQIAVVSKEFRAAMKKARYGVKWLNSKQLAGLMAEHERSYATVMKALGYGKQRTTPPFHDEQNASLPRRETTAMKVHDSIVGTVFLVIGVFVAAYSRTLSPPRNLAYGPGFFPLIIGTGLALVGAALFIQGIRRRTGSPVVVAPDWTDSPQKALRFWILLGAIGFYVAVVDFLGFFATATIILSTVISINGASKRQAVVVGVLVAAVMNVGFASLLHVPLPWGPLAAISGWLIWQIRL